MISVKGVVRYFEAMLLLHPAYFFGGRGQAVTKESLDKLVKQYGADMYKNIRLEVDEGRPGFDCSGIMKNISGFDTNAQGYYNKCKNKGKISEMPKNKVCFVFREQGGKIVHVGMYTGNGYTYEMWDSCDKKKFDESKWTHYGIPDWIEQEQEKEEIVYPKYTGSSGSIVSALAAVGEKDTSFAHRKIIATANGIKGYSGTATQNTKLLKMLKEGSLLKS